MTTAYTSLLGFALPVTGELSGTWGDTVNNSITSLLDSAIAGTTTLSTDADVTLTNLDGTADTSRQAILLCTGARTAIRTITAPALSKIYTVINSTTGGFSVQIVAAGPTTGVTIVAGEAALIAWNGSDFIKVSNTGGSFTTQNLTVTGNTILGDAITDTTTLNAQTRFQSRAILGYANMTGPASTSLSTTAPAFLYSGATTYTVSDVSGGTQTHAPVISLGQATITNATTNTIFTNASTLYIGGTPNASTNITFTRPYALYLDSGTTTAAAAVTYTNAATLYIAGAPTAGSNVTLTTPYALYVAAGASYLGGNTAVTGTLTATSTLATATAIVNTTNANGTFLQIQLSGTPKTYLGSSVAISGVGTSSDTDVYATGKLRLFGDNQVTNYATMSSTGLAVTGTLSSTGLATLTSSQITGATFPASGSGLELVFQSGTSKLQSFNRTGSAYLPLTIDGTTVGVLSSGATIGAFSSTGLAVTGTFSSTLGATIQGLTVGLGGGAVGTNTAVGSGAIAATATGTYATAIGYYALPALTSGLYNTAVGANSLALNKGGSSNSALGVSALGANVSGNQNTAIGVDALRFTTSSNNTAVGFEAGKTNVSGTENFYGGYLAGQPATGSYLTFVGSRAGNASITGDGNTAVGYYAYGSGAGGANNTAIGVQTLYLNNSGSNNTVVGYTAGYTNQTGSYNTFMGVSAGRLSNYNGNAFNAAYGYASGYNLSIGINNSFYGTNSGSEVTSGSKNTIIGNYNGLAAPISQTGSNYIVLSDGDGTIGLSTTFNSSVALNGAVPQSGTGITFPASQNASSNANTLDDYEEGTFDPTITRSGSNPTVTYTNQLGSYVKVGRLVNATFAVFWSANSGGSGNFTISGLPFTNTNSADNYSQAFGVDMSGVTFAVGTTTFGGYVNVNTTTIFLTCAGSAVSSSAPTLGSTGYLYMSVAYMASA